MSVNSRYVTNDQPTGGSIPYSTVSVRPGWQGALVHGPSYITFILRQTWTYKEHSAPYSTRYHEPGQVSSQRSDWSYLESLVFYISTPGLHLPAKSISSRVWLYRRRPPSTLRVRCSQETTPRTKTARISRPYGRSLPWASHDTIVYTDTRISILTESATANKASCLVAAYCVHFGSAERCANDRLNSSVKNTSLMTPESI